MKMNHFTKDNRKKSLVEGVKIGNKEKNHILQTSEDFNIGIEYEFGMIGVEHMEPYIHGDEGVFSIEELRDSQELNEIGDIDDINLFNSYDKFKSFLYTEGTEKLGIATLNIFDDMVHGVIFHQDGDKEIVLYGDEYDHIRTLHHYIESDEIVNSNDDIRKASILAFQVISNQLISFKTKVIRQYTKDSEQDVSELTLDDIETDTGTSDLFSEDLTKELGNAFLGDLYKSLNQHGYMEDAIELENEEFFLENFKNNPLPFINDLYDIVEEYINPFLEGDDVDESELYEKIIEFIKSYSLNPLDYDLTSNIDIFIENNAKFADYWVEEKSQTVQSIADENRVSYDKIVHEQHGDQAELITEPMDLEDALSHLKATFEMIEKEELYTFEESGLHISVSSNEYDLNKFNLVKFIMLMKYDYVDELFPERQYVNNIMGTLEQDIKGKLFEIFSQISDKNIQQFVLKLKESIASSSVSNVKHQSINFGDYRVSGGRIELRFFGGEYYEQQFEQIKDMLLRTLYILNISYTDLYEKEYNKAFYKWLDGFLKETFAGLGVSELLYVAKLVEKQSNMEIAFDNIMNQLEKRGYSRDDRQLQSIIRHLMMEYY